ncbi:MAG: TRAP transporter substrate-binding protein [Sulfurifustis sp.]
MKTVLSAISAICVALTLLASAHAAEPIVIKFSHVAAADTPKGKGALKFKELAEARTKGAVKVEVYPNSSLYKDREELEALQLGAVQMLAPSVSKFGPLGVREFDVFELPYVFDDYDDLRKVADGPVGRNILKKLDGKGLIGLDYWDNGFKSMSANKPLQRPEDCKGLKMRIASSKVVEANMRALGAIPQVMAFSEVYHALQTGVVDGTENTPSNLYTQRMHEVQKYYALTEHGVTEYVIVVNKKYWEGLPPDIRSALEAAMKDTTRYVNQIAKQENDEALEAVRKSGKTQILRLTPDEKAAWKKAMAKVYDEMGNKVGKDLIQTIEHETGHKR